MDLRWNPSLALGHPLIDAQHQELFAQFDRFLAACDQGAALQQLQELFGFLDDYVNSHFTAEEGLMHESGYPQREEHARMHKEFSQRLTQLRAELARDGVTVSILIHTNKALLHWLTGHIQEIDRRFASYLAEKAKSTSL